MLLINLAGSGMRSTAALALFQSSDAVSVQTHDTHLLMIFAGIVAGCMLLVALAVVAAGLVALKLQKDLMVEVNEIKAKIMPLIAKSDALAAQVSAVATDLTPTIKNITAKVDTIVGHVEHISELAKSKADEFSPTISAANETFNKANETVRDVNQKTQEQVARVNGMVSNVLDATAQAGRSLRHGITQPGREFAGFASGVKAAVSTFLNNSKSKPFGSTAYGRSRYEPPIRTYRSMSEVPDEGTAVEGFRAADVYTKDERNLDL